jgi:hypothetical protein
MMLSLLDMVGRSHRQRHDHAKDDVCTLADPERHDWLNVEQRADRVPVAQAEVPVALKGQADQARNGVLRLLRQFICGLRSGRKRE